MNETPTAPATATKTATPAEALSLTPPEPLPPMVAEETAGLVPLSAEQKSDLENKVDGFISELIAMDVNAPEYGRRVDQITQAGRREISNAASHSNRFLDRPVKAMDRDTQITNNLLELRSTVERLDPANNEKYFFKRGVLGRVFGNRVGNYFRQYKSAQSHIAAILEALESGRDELLRDNAEIVTERHKLWEAMGRLEQMIHFFKTLDERIEAKAHELEATDPERAKILRETALFYARQRTQDLLTQMAVTVQGYLALDLVKKNNVELVKGVDRASTTTVSALQTAVTVAQALANQKLVLDQIGALNTTTAKVIEGTGAMLKDNSARIHEQAASSTIPLETLSQAFQNIYHTMDEIDNFKVKALDTMKQTVEALEGEVAKSRGYIARAEGAQDGADSEDNPLLSLDEKNTA